MASYSLGETSGMIKNVSEMCSSSSFDDLNLHKVICVWHIWFFRPKMWSYDPEMRSVGIMQRSCLDPPDRFLHSSLYKGWLFKVCVSDWGYTSLKSPEISFEICWHVHLLHDSWSTLCTSCRFCIHDFFLFMAQQAFYACFHPLLDL